MNYRWLGSVLGVGLLRLAVSFFVSILITFVLVRLLPFSPISAADFGGALTSSAAVQARIQYYYSLLPSGPLYDQFFNFLSNVLHGQFGHSIQTQQPVISILEQSLPWTLLLVVTSTLLSFAIGTFLGILLAYRRGSKIDTAGATISTVAYSLPVYVVGIALLIAFAFSNHYFPSAGAYAIGVPVGLNPAFIGSVIDHAFLPITALTLVSFGSWTLSMRANALSVMGQDYVWAAEARGIPGYRVALRYVGRNAILPQFTYLVIALGFSFAGSVFVEEIFTYPGMGYQLITAIDYNDFPVIMGVFVTYVLSILVALLAADLTYGAIDPRARQ
ncbi:MAG: ABC transporter permease [Thaumarchaeota archaeon]|nr:ABC transporter permease [Nitrososphaerota archaeon]